MQKIILVRAFLLTSFSLKKEIATNFVGVALEGLFSSAKIFVATNHSHMLVLTENLSKGGIAFASEDWP